LKCNAFISNCFLVIISKFFLKSHIFQTINASFERYLLVEVPEEAGVLEACSQDAGIAVADNGLALRVYLGVEHGEEMRGELSAGSFNGEVLLVIAHHGDQNLFGQGQVLRLKITEDHRWPLGEMNDGLDKRFVLAPSGARDGARGRVERLANGLSALGYIDNDFGGAKRPCIVRCFCDNHRLLAVQHAMAAARVTRLD